MTEMVRVGDLEFPKPAYGPETAERIIEIVQTYPESHNQGNWEYPSNTMCGTTRCIAGWVDYIHPELRYKHAKYLECLCPSCQERPEPRWISLGAEGLNIDRDTANTLFTTLNNDSALKALEYVAKDEPVDWSKVIFGG